MRQPAARILLAMFLLTSVSALADSFTNLNVNFTILPNGGSGGNLGGTISGPGVNLTVGGGTDNPFYFNSGFAPGSLGEAGTNIFWDAAFGQINGQVFSGAGIYPVDLLLSNPTMTAGSFTFPTNGKDFTITIPASLGLITGTILTTCPSSGCQFTLGTKPGKLTLSYVLQPDGNYYFSSGFFTTIPEPGTLALVAVGIGAVASRIQKRKPKI